MYEKVRFSADEVTQLMALFAEADAKGEPVEVATGRNGLMFRRGANTWSWPMGQSLPLFDNDETAPMDVVDRP